MKELCLIRQHYSFIGGKIAPYMAKSSDIQIIIIIDRTINELIDKHAIN